MRTTAGYPVRSPGFRNGSTFGPLPPMQLFRIPKTHPMQDRIIEEREKRFTNNMKEIDERRNDSINSLTFEN